MKCLALDQPAVSRLIWSIAAFSSPEGIGRDCRAKRISSRAGLRLGPRRPMVLAKEMELKLALTPEAADG